MIATTASGHRILDPWLALLAGDVVWADHEPPDARRQVAGGVELIGLAFVVGLVWVALVRHDGAALGPTASLAIATAATAAAAALAVRPAQLVARRVTRPADFRIRLLWRGACFLTLAVAIAFQMPGWPAAAAWAVGIVVGADVMSTAWTLGIRASPVTWWRLFLLSPLHFGVIGALVAVTLVPAYLPRAWSLVAPYLALHLGILVAVLTCLALIAVSSQLEEELAQARADAAVRERRYRAHWLHDDVLAEIRLTTLRIQHGHRTPGDVAAELEELDHRLRVRQLDDLLHSGDVRLADVLQPHIRRAQTLGVRFTTMPPLDAAGRRVDPDTGRLFSRAVAVLLSNAVNAGTTTVTLELDVTRPDAIELSIADDAGGFDFDRIPAGRGLDQLASDGVGLRRLPRPGGSLMIATVSLPPGHGDEQHPGHRPDTEEKHHHEIDPAR